MSVPDQFSAVSETCHHIARLVRDGWEVAISHGNGPQVGFILRRSELAASELHEVPLDVCGADTQGAIGYALQQNLQNEFALAGLRRLAVTVVTQVEVAADDWAFRVPTKPIGSYMNEASATRRRDDEGWNVAEDAGRGWRRVVASPRPLRILEIEAITELLDAGFVVIGVGGGGIPVIRDAEGRLRGVAAVVDKDLASALLALEIGATLFVISTGVERVALRYGTAEQAWVDQMTASEAEQFLAEGGHFARGSMAPKIEAVVAFLRGGGREALITNPENISRALRRETGTRVLAD